MRVVSVARRTAVLGASMIGVTSLVVTGAASSAAGAAASKSPVKVAYLVPLTGTAAANGKDEENGFNLGLKHFGSTVDGHKIQVKYLDTQGTPSVAVSDAKQALQSTHVEVVEGPLLANEIAAVSPYVMSKGIPEDDLFLASPTQMADYQQFKLGFTSGWDSYQPGTEAAKWAYKTMGWHHMTTFGDAYSFGWEAVGAFDAEFKKLGGTITKALWAPISVANISSYVSQIPSTTQALYIETLGAQAVNFYSDLKAYGLKGKIPVLGITTTTDQSALATATPTAAAGTYVASQYCDDIPTKVNQTFANAYHKAYGVWPAYYSEAGYTKAEILVAALKKLKGTVKNEKSLAKAMLAVHITAPRGPVTISKKTYSPVQNAYICKVEIKGGSARNVPIKTFTKVPPWGLLSPSAWKSAFASNSTGQPAT